MMILTDSTVSQMSEFCHFILDINVYSRENCPYNDSVSDVQITPFNQSISQTQFLNGLLVKTIARSTGQGYLMSRKLREEMGFQLLAAVERQPLSALPTGRAFAQCDGGPVHILAG